MNEFLPQHRTTPGPEGRSPPATSDIVTPDTSVPQSATDSRFQGRGVLVAHRAHTLAHTSRLGIIIPPREGVCPAISAILRPALRPLRALPTHTVTRRRPKAISTRTHRSQHARHPPRVGATVHSKGASIPTRASGERGATLGPERAHACVDSTVCLSAVSRRRRVRASVCCVQCECHSPV